jgi:shikimate kinase
MPKILVTGMSGTGKSSALEMLAARGHRVVDTDTDEWSCWVTLPDGTRDWIWRTDAMASLLAQHRRGALYVSGCKTNQGQFYPMFDYVVLLSAPADVLLARLAARDNNPYGESAAERALILEHLAEVEPRLRASASTEIDAVAPLAEVVRQLERLAAPSGARGVEQDLDGTGAT